MEFHFFCFSVIIIQPLHNISLCFSAVAKAAAACQIRKRYFAHFLATVVACECATYTHIERSVMKSVRNKIEFRALNKNALVVVSYFIFLPPPVPVLFCTSFEILQPKHIFSSKKWWFCWCVPGVCVSVWICMLLVCFAMFLKCYGLSSALILNQLNYYEYVSFIHTRIHLMPSQRKRSFSQHLLYINRKIFTKANGKCM